MGEYRQLEEVTRADCALEVFGESPEDLFETAARALAELSADPRTVGREVRRELRLAAPDLELLLFDWLNEIILRKDRDRELFPETSVEIRGEGPYELIGRLRGGSIEPERTRQRADLKAVTFHAFQLEVLDHACRARFVIDI